MFNIFSYEDKTNYPITRSPKLDLIYKYIKLDQNIVNAYYKNRETRTTNTNLLVRLVKKMSVNISKDQFTYLNLLNINYKYVAKSLNFTSDINRGIIHENILGTSCVLYENSFLNPFDAEDYEKYSAIKVLYSTNSDLSMNHPTKIKYGSYVLEVDVIAVMMQYRKWSINRIDKGYGNSPNVFVFQVLYTNMIKDILELSIFNRFFTTVFSEDSQPQHPFNVRNHDIAINKELDKVSTRLAKKQFRYSEFLKNIPMPFNKDAGELLHYGTLNINRQNRWMMFFARISYIIDIIEFLGKKNVIRNKDSIINFRLFMRALRYGVILETVDWKGAETSVNIKYKRALEIAEKRGL